MEEWLEQQRLLPQRAGFWPHSFYPCGRTPYEPEGHHNPQRHKAFQRHALFQPPSITLIIHACLFPAERVFVNTTKVCA
jgi:hypothetical protein